MAAPEKTSGLPLVSKGSLEFGEGDKICDQWVVEFDVAAQGALRQVALTVVLAALHVLVMAATMLLSSWGGRLVTPINFFVGFDFYSILVSAAHFGERVAQSLSATSLYSTASRYRSLAAVLVPGSFSEITCGVSSASSSSTPAVLLTLSRTWHFPSFSGCQPPWQYSKRSRHGWPHSASEPSTRRLPTPPWKRPWACAGSSGSL